MSQQERELMGRLLKQSILTLCRETMSYQHKLEIDGIVCICVDTDSQPVVVKIHENIRKGFTQQGSSFESSYNDQSHNVKSSTPLRHKRQHSRDVRALNSPDESSEDLNDVCIIDTSEGSFEDSDLDLKSPREGVQGTKSSSQLETVLDRDGQSSLMLTGVQKSQKNSSLSSEPNHVIDNQSCARSFETLDDQDEMEEGAAGEHPGFEEVTTQAEELSQSARPGVPNTIHAQSSAVRHPQGLLCKRCFVILPTAIAFDSHNLREHSLFTCRICFRGFTARNNLKRHFRLHTGVKPYKCSHCSQAFTRKDDLKGHVLRHSYNKPYRCSLCGKGYTDRSCVRNHMAKEHRSKLLHVCPQCGEGFNDTQLFSNHKKAHPEFRSFHCSVCSFIGINALMHMKHSLTHSTKTYNCNPCKQNFSDPFDYTNHLKRHRVDRNFKSFVCCFCGSELPTYDQFVRHEYSHAQSKNHTCQVCFKQFRYPSNLKDHMATHERENSSSQYWCTECQVGFSSEDSLQGHIYESHESRRASREDESSHPPESVSDAVKGEDLKATHDIKDDIQAMQTGHTSESSEDQRIPLPEGTPMVDLSQTSIAHPAVQDESLVHDPVTERSRPETGDVGPRENVPSDHQTSFTINGETMIIKREVSDHEEENCALQEDQVSPPAGEYLPNGSPDEEATAGSSGDAESGNSSAGVREIVLERIHIRSPGFDRVVTPEILFRAQPVFQCLVCNDVYQDFNSFEAHSSQVHRRFVCEYCGKIFTAKPNRERHVRYHTGERPYKCDLCEQSFFRGDDLKYHRTTRHSGVKPFRCSVCGMSFAWPKDLERHVRHYCHQ